MQSTELETRIIEFYFSLYEKSMHPICVGKNVHVLTFLLYFTIVPKSMHLTEGERPKTNFLVYTHRDYIVPRVI